MCQQQQQQLLQQNNKQPDQGIFERIIETGAFED
jgi:hypothetical protein